MMDLCARLTYGTRAGRRIPVMILPRFRVLRCKLAKGVPNDTGSEDAENCDSRSIWCLRKLGLLRWNAGLGEPPTNRVLN